MRQFDDLNQGLKSLNQKFVLREQEQSEILLEINKNMNKIVKKRTPFQWKYYLTSIIAVFLLVIIALPLLNGNLDFMGNNRTEITQGTSGGNHTSKANEDSEEVEYIFYVKNNLPYDIYSMSLEVYQNGKLIASPTSMYADGTPIKKGDVFDFQFLEYDGLETGLAELELFIAEEPPNKGKEKIYIAPKISIEITNQKEYELELNGNSLNELYIKGTKANTKLPNDIPKFVFENDFERINWNNKAEWIDHNIIGNQKKSGIIGAGMPSLNGQKWMWHLWGIENPTNTKLTVVGYHKDTETVHQILTSGWTIELGGENNGADAHIPSSVKIPSQGEWAFLLYTNEELFDIIVLEINE